MRCSYIESSKYKLTKGDFKMVDKIFKSEVMSEITLVAFKYGESFFSSQLAFYQDKSNVELPFA
ncbi:MAG: hypothetical protein K0S61_4651 [Anaerocolumna sp.]|nr:hypothetical protein [Anaerocolumna sp.]